MTKRAPKSIQIRTLTSRELSVTIGGEATTDAPRDTTSGLPTGQRMHKPLLG